MDGVRERLLEALEQSVGELHREAVGIVSDHWNAVTAVERGTTGWESKSRLLLASHRKGNHIQLKWIGVKWYGTGGKRSSTKVAIRRTGKHLAYSEATLRQWARDWEIDLVLATEAKLSLIRRQASHLAKAGISIRAANALAVGDPVPVETDEDDSGE